jgi:hypothetical protein
MAGPAFASPDDLPAPDGYSHVVSIPAGRLVWTSGQVGMAVDGSVADGWEAQTRLAFEHLGPGAGRGRRRMARRSQADVLCRCHRRAGHRATGPRRFHRPGRPADELARAGRGPIPARAARRSRGRRRARALILRGSVSPTPRETHGPKRPSPRSGERRRHLGRIVSERDLGFSRWSGLFDHAGTRLSSILGRTGDRFLGTDGEASPPRLQARSSHRTGHRLGGLVSSVGFCR